MSIMTSRADQNAIAADWPGSPLSTLHHLAARPQPIPVEQYQDGASYVVRLEVPGIDPAAGLTVCVEAGLLSVRAERRDEPQQDRQTEFRYGSFARHIALPPGAGTNDVSASYHNGILTVRIGLKPQHQQAQPVSIAIQP